MALQRPTIQNKIIEVRACMLDGSVMPISINQEYLVSDLKAEVQQATGLLVESQALWFEEQELEDEMMLVEIGMVHGDRVEVKVSALQQARGELNERGIECGDEEVIQAAMAGDTEVLQWLMDVGGNPNSADYTGNTALMHAAQECKLVAMQILINHGADVNHQGCSNETAALWAASKGHIHALTLLHEAGSDLTLADEDGDTPLMWAACNNHLDCVRYLTLHCPHEVANNDGCTALGWAREEGHDDVVRFLESL